LKNIFFEEYADNNYVVTFYEEYIL